MSNKEMQMPSSLKKLSHTVYECKYHIIWCPKYRFRVMDVEVRFYVRDVIRRLCKWKLLAIVQGNAHLVLEIPRIRVRTLYELPTSEISFATHKWIQGSERSISVLVCVFDISDVKDAFFLLVVLTLIWSLCMQVCIDVEGKKSSFSRNTRANPCGYGKECGTR